MEKIIPRYEFRVFGSDLKEIGRRMKALSSSERVRESSEIYIVSAGNDVNNCKIRDEKMDIKRFVQEKEGLEQWNPLMKGEFPMAAALIRDEVFPAFGVSLPPLQRQAYTLEQFLDELIGPHPDLVAVPVSKHRFGYLINGVIAEFADLRINYQPIQTAAVESEEVTAVLQTKARLGLEGYENVNYLRAIKRVIGMEGGEDDEGN